MQTGPHVRGAAGQVSEILGEGPRAQRFDIAVQRHDVRQGTARIESRPEGRQVQMVASVDHRGAVQAGREYEAARLEIRSGGQVQQLRLAKRPAFGRREFPQVERGASVEAA